MSRAALIQQALQAAPSRFRRKISQADLVECSLALISLPAELVLQTQREAEILRHKLHEARAWLIRRRHQVETRRAGRHLHVVA